MEKCCTNEGTVDGMTGLCQRNVSASLARAARARRRGSVLILVMTLLGVLFVVGVAFLATMNFEADIIASDRLRDRNEAGVEEVIDELGSFLREGLLGNGEVPFGGSLEEPFDEVLATAPLGYAELPGVHNLIAPIEPYQLDQPIQSNGSLFVFPRGTNPRNPGELDEWRPPDVLIDTSWTS